MEVIFSRGARIVSPLRSISSITTTNYLAPVHHMYYVDIRQWLFKCSERYYRTVSSNYLLISNHVFTSKGLTDYTFNKNGCSTVYYSDRKHIPTEDCEEPPTQEKLSIFQRMKKMTKDYWHIVVPVHIVTSIGWMALFYTIAKNGIDIESLMEYINLSERYLEFLKKNSNAGNFAIAYGLYKIVTPIRYAVTIGASTMSIRHLKKLGYLKAPPHKVPQSTQIEHKKKSTAEHKAKLDTKEQTDPPKM